MRTIFLLLLLLLTTPDQVTGAMVCGTITVEGGGQCQFTSPCNTECTNAGCGFSGDQCNPTGVCGASTNVTYRSLNGGTCSNQAACEAAGGLWGTHPWNGGAAGCAAPAEFCSRHSEPSSCTSESTQTCMQISIYIWEEKSVCGLAVDCSNGCNVNDLFSQSATNVVYPGTQQGGTGDYTFATGTEPLYLTGTAIGGGGASWTIKRELDPRSYASLPTTLISLTLYDAGKTYADFPDLSGLTSLTTLAFHRACVRDGTGQMQACGQNTDSDGKVTTIPLDKLPPSLTSLTITGQNITDLDDIHLPTTVTYLNMEKNKIGKIDADDLPWTHLTEFHFGLNPVSVVSKGAFSTLIAAGATVTEVIRTGPINHPDTKIITPPWHTRTSCPAGLYGTPGKSSWTGGPTYLGCDPCIRPAGLSTIFAFSCTTGPSSHAPQICPRGYHCNPASLESEECPAGTSDYREGISTSTTCPPCQKGYFNPLSAQTFCPFPCPGGFYGLVEGGINETACGTCPLGHYCPGTAVVNPEPCPAGTYQPVLGVSSASLCQNCPSGKFSTVAGATSVVVCENCHVETPNSSPGSSASTDCTSSLVCAGNTQPSADGTTCVSGCSNGNYFSQVTSQCQSCPKGTYNTNGFAAGCTICPFGTKGETAGLASCSTCSSVDKCPVGSVTGLSSAQLTVRNGDGLGKTSYGNTPADATPEITCPLPDGMSQSVVQWIAFGVSVFLIIFHRPVIALILSPVKDPVKRHNLFNRMDQIQSEWGSWVGEMGDRSIQESTPSQFGAGFTLAFLPIAIFTAVQLIMANDPVCTVGLRVPAGNRAHGLMVWKVSLPTAAATNI